MNRKPASSSVVRFSADSVPGSATITMSASPWRSWNCWTMGTMVVVQAQTEIPLRSHRRVALDFFSKAVASSPKIESWRSVSTIWRPRFPPVFRIGRRK